MARSHPILKSLWDCRALLTAALLSIWVKVYREPRDVVAKLERPESPAADASAQAKRPVRTQLPEPLAAALSLALDSQCAKYASITSHKPFPFDSWFSQADGVNSQAQARS